jgi:hypothetical protein
MKAILIIEAAYLPGRQLLRHDIGLDQGGHTARVDSHFRSQGNQNRIFLDLPCSHVAQRNLLCRCHCLSKLFV